MNQQRRSAIDIQFFGRTVLALLVVFVATSIFPLAQAQGPSDVEQALANLQKALANDSSLAPETREALSAVVAALQAERANVQAPGREAITAIVDERIAYQEENREKSKWESIGDRVDLYGDLRLRHESSFNMDTRADRHRERVRFRVGANYKIRDDLVMGARFADFSKTDSGSVYIVYGDASRPSGELGLESANYDISYDGATTRSGQYLGC